MSDLSKEIDSDLSRREASELERSAVYVHGQNIHQKMNSRNKYCDNTSKQYLQEISQKYSEWKSANTELKGPFKDAKNSDFELVCKRVELFSGYKDFIDQQHFAEQFDSRSNLHSSVLEEFVYYLFRDLLLDFKGQPLVGKSHAFKDMFFAPKSFQDMVMRPALRIEKKDHDFVIGISIKAKFQCQGSETVEEENFEVPAVAVECKTYLDKTMLEASSTAAEQLKYKNPNAKYIVVMEWLKLSDAVNLRKYKVDQIYVFRRQKNTDREFRYEDNYNKKPIDQDVIWHLYETVRKHLTNDWGGDVGEGLERGWLIDS
ncbi:Bpu10I family restriction endonuclease [uncultured Cohaesibacter sp.]|uniref:Bpu10I family restriction endonuclease n=1 Tax=uncultured Cohaesibacter sp. TaxID=1002546 RepID=UPI0029C951FE|nr:Bpu10I family restriction endonuclease [uncultured Cohaesibacter sp.]